MGNKISRKATLWLLVLFAVFLFAPFSSSADDGYDAHFFIRYDSSTQTEDGTTHYSPKHYFPVGTTASGYVYGSGGSDYTSVDGKVLTKSAYVPGAEAAITGGNVNLYDSFDTEALHTYFKTVYDNILQEPSRDVIQASIEKALGAKYAAMYAKGEIDVLWYVSKAESSYVNVDGVVYYVKTGQVVDKPETDSSTVEIDGVKNLKGRNFKKGDSWNFAIKADTDDAPMPEKTTARIQPEDDAVEYFTFGEIHFTRADLKGSNSKTFRYTITESGSVANVTNDSASHTVNVTVSYDRNKSKLSAKAEYLNGGKSGSSAEFNNEYHKPVTRVQVEKVWSDSNDRSRMRPESITIHLLRNGEEIKTKTVTEANDWKWTFDNLDKFDANDKEYKYTIKEDTVPFYTSAESTDADGNTVITNTYKPEKLELKGDSALKVTKVVVGKKSAEPFTFKLTAAENYGDAVKMPANTEVKTSDRIPADGAETKSFQPVEITKAGTYKFNVKETTTTTAGGWDYDNRERTLTVKVADNKGHLEVVDADSTLSATVTNTFTPAVLDGDTALTGNKTLIGRNMLKDEEFNFTLKAGDEATQKAIDEKDIVLGSTNARVSTLADGSTTTFMFGRAEFSKEGEYTFIVTEKDGGKPGMKYDTEGKVLKVKVSKEDGALKAVQMNSPSYKNVYEAAGEYTPAGTKTLLNENGNKLSVKDGQFEFNVYYSGHEDREPVTTGTTGSGKDAPIHFGTLSYTISDLEKLVAKGYADKKVLENGAEYSINYTVTEKETGNSALQQNTQTQTFRVVMKDNGTGKLTVKSGTGNKLNFENEYKSEKATVNFEGLKVLEGRNLKADEFTFKVTSDDVDAPMPEAREAQNRANGSVNFGTITYGKDDLGDATEKTFTYKVTESGKHPGVSNDTETKTVKVTVTDDGKGHITAETNPKTAPLFTFNNTYSTTSRESSVTGQVQIKKALAGRAMEDGEFHFVLKDENGKTVGNAVNDKDGNITFPALTFKNVGTYNYTVEEVAGNDSHITYDATPYKVSAVVTDNLDGTLKVTWKSGTGAILFKNTYRVDPTDAAPSVEKKITGGNPAKDSTFRFTLTGTDNAPMPKGSVDGEKTETITGEGQTDFGKITFTQAGTYTYKVTEKLGNEASYNYDSTEYTLTYKVTDVRGELKAEQSITAGGKSADKMVFTNEYAPASMEGDAAITGTKELVGRSMLNGETFEFTLKAGDEATQKAIDEKDIVLTDTDASLSGMKDGEKATFSFGRAEFSKEGEYTFIVTEKNGGKAGMTYDTDAKTFKVKVFKKNGVMSTVQENKPTFKNTYEASGEYTPAGSKTLLSENGNKLSVKDNQFKFSVYYAGHEDGEPVITGTTAGGKDAAIQFGKLSYTISDLEKLVAKGYADKRVLEDGAEYSINYAVTENTPKNSALQPNTQVQTFRVVVTDNGSGNLATKSVYGQKIAFENLYKSDKATVNFEGQKVLEGRKLKADEFSFKFTSDEANAPMPEQTEVQNKADGSVNFGAITYGKNDLGDATEKTFTYKVKESGNRPGVSNDTETKTVKVTVKDDGKGHITAETDPNAAPLFTFNNTYSTASQDSSVTGQVQMKKALTGRALKDGEFHFVLKNEAGKEIGKAVNDKDGNIAFPKLTFKNVGTYNYTVEEVPGNDRHITYDTTSYAVSAVVTDNLDGTLKVTWKSGTGNIQFRNTYTVDSTNVTPSVEKKISGKQPAKDSTFHFTITGTDNAPMPEGSKNGKKSVSITGEGKADFGKITFAQAGTYTYKVTEKIGSESSYNYDATEYTLTYKVKDVDGELKAEKSITAGGKSADRMVFTNEYAPASLDGDTSLTGTKTLIGRNMLKDEEFNFTLKAGDEATQKAIDEKDIVLGSTNARVSTLADGSTTTFMFGRAEFAKEGEYTFLVTEKDGGKPGMKYDTESKTLKVKVSKENGIMTAVQEKTPAFKNTYEASGEYTPEGTKTLLDEKGNKLSVKDDQFKFSVYYAGHEDLDPVITGTTGNGKYAPIHFGTLSYTISDLEKLVAKGYADKKVRENGAEYSINYAVTENATGNSALQQNTQVQTFRVVVTDNGSGKLAAKSTYGQKIAFENLYKSDKATVNFEGQKVLEGRKLKADEFSFKFTSDEANAPMPEQTEVQNKADGSVNFGAITYGKNDLGDATEKTFTYKVKEYGNRPGVSNDTETKIVKVTVKDDGKGHITAETDPNTTPLFTFNNTYSTTSQDSSVTGQVSIKKALAGRAMEDGEFHFVLKDENGKTVGNAVNDKAGNITFDKLTFKKVGTYNYTVEEVAGNDRHITYDATPYTISAIVTDNLDGTLKVTWKSGTGAILFKNTYTPDSTDAAPSVEKKIAGKNPAKDSTFHFTLTGKDNAPMPEGSKDGRKTVKITGEGKADFGKINFTQAGTYTYKVAEENGNESSYNYDSTEYTLTYKVTDVRGTLKAEQSITAGGKSADAMVFTNKYAPASMEGDAAITGTKELVGRSMLKDEKFEFVLKVGDAETQKALDEKDIVLDDTNASLSGMKDGEKATFSFGRAEFSKEGEYTFIVTEKDGGKAGMTYDDNEKVLKVKVAKKNGVMTAVQEETPAFRNTYEAAGEYTPEGTKTLLSEKKNKLTIKAGEFKFSVYYAGHEDQKPVTTGVTTSGKDAAIHFGTLSYTVSDLEKLVAKGYAAKTAKEDGAEYSINYVVTENATGNSALQQNTQSTPFRVVVKDNAGGKLSVESGTGKKLDFENEYKSEKAAVSFEGLKVLEGRKLDADEFTFHVTSDDENAPMPEQTEVKNKANGQISFGTVTYGKDDLGDETEKTFTYKVKESGNRPGVANDTETKIVKVTVKDDGKGHITAETDPKTAPLFAFSNTYSTKPMDSAVTGQVQIKKALAGRSMEEGEFHFVLKNEEGKTLDNAVNDKDGNITFKKLTFKNVGTYNYTVEEVAGNDRHITYDKNSYNVSAAVTDNLNGTLKVTWTSGTGAILFKNTYTVDPTDATPSVEKKIAGGNPAKDSTFRFTLTGKDNAPMPEGSKDGVKSASITGEGKADFGKITFDKAGTYTYKVAEENGNESSYNYDSTEYTLTYKVTDVKGELKAEQSITAGDKSADEMVFTNEYAPASMDGDTAITGTKELAGRSMQKDEKFEFTLKAGDEATQKAIDEKDIVLDDTSASLSGMRDGQKSTFSFGRAEFSKEGEYTFTVTEKDGGKAGMTYDTKEKTFKVKVAKENGVMTAVQEETPTFKNVYEASGEFTPAGTKTLLSENGNKLSVKDNQFKFSVYYAGHTDGEAVTTGTTGNGKDAEIGFGKLTYTISDLEKLVAKGYADKAELDNGARYYIDYVVVENASENNALQANTQAPTFRVEVTDNGDGTLTAESEEGSKLAFENLYKSDKATVHFNGQKVLEGRPLKADEFTFNVTSDEENAPMPEKTEVKNEEGGNIDFGTITYGKDDLGDATEKTFTYQVKESGEQPGVANDTETKTVKVTVKDDGEGHITAETEPKEAPLFAFNNTYSTTSKESSVTDTVKIRKTLTGRKLKNKEFTFVLKDKDGKNVAEAKNNADGSVAFKSLTFDEVGTYNYTVKEVKGNAKRVSYDANAYKVTATVTDNLDGTLSVKWSTGTKKEIRFYNRYKKKTVTPNPSGKHGGKDDNNNIGPFTGDDNNADLYLGLMGASAALLAALAGSRKKRKL